MTTLATLPPLPPRDVCSECPRVVVWQDGRNHTACVPAKHTTGVEAFTLKRKGLIHTKAQALQGVITAREFSAMNV